MQRMLIYFFIAIFSVFQCKAYRWFNYAGNILGDSNALYHLAILKFEGWGPAEENKAEAAINLLRKAAEKWHWTAQQTLEGLEGKADGKEEGENYRFHWGE